MHIQLQAPCRQRNSSREKINHNQAMRKVRVTVEWQFGEIKTYKLEIKN